MQKKLRKNLLFSAMLFQGFVNNIALCGKTLLESNNSGTISIHKALNGSKYFSAGVTLDPTSGHIGVLVEGHSNFKKGVYLKGKISKPFHNEQNITCTPFLEYGLRYTFFDTVSLGVQMYEYYDSQAQQIAGHPMLTLGFLL